MWMVPMYAHVHSPHVVHTCTDTCIHVPMCTHTYHMQPCPLTCMHTYKHMCVLSCAHSLMHCAHVHVHTCICIHAHVHPHTRHMCTLTPHTRAASSGSWLQFRRSHSRLQLSTKSFSRPPKTSPNPGCVPHNSAWWPAKSRRGHFLASLEWPQPWAGTGKPQMEGWTGPHTCPSPQPQTDRGRVTDRRRPRGGVTKSRETGRQDHRERVRVGEGSDRGSCGLGVLRSQAWTSPGALGSGAEDRGCPALFPPSPAFRTTTRGSGRGGAPAQEGASPAWGKGQGAWARP